MNMGHNKVARNSLSGPKVWPYVFCAPFVIAYFAFNLFPTFYSFYISLFDWSGIGSKTFIGLKNYIQILTRDKLFYKSTYNTFIIMLTSIPIQLFLGLILAQIIFNLKKAQKFVQTISFLPYVIAPVAVGFIFGYIFDWQAGYINVLLQELGLIQEGIYWLNSPLYSRAIVAGMKVWKYCGYCMIIYTAGMTAIPVDIYEAAKVDGTSTLTTFFKITIPLLRNTTVFLITTSIIQGLQTFDEPVLLYSGWSLTPAVGGPDNSVLTVVWKFYDDAFKTNMMLGYGAAVSYLLFVIIVVLSIISYKVSSGKEDN